MGPTCPRAGSAYDTRNLILVRLFKALSAIPITLDSEFFGSEHVTEQWLDASVEIEELPKFKEAAAKMKALRPQFGTY